VELTEPSLDAIDEPCSSRCCRSCDGGEDSDVEVLVEGLVDEVEQEILPAARGHLSVGVANERGLEIEGDVLAANPEVRAARRSWHGRLVVDLEAEPAMRFVEVELPKGGHVLAGVVLLESRAKTSLTRGGEGSEPVLKQLPHGSELRLRGSIQERVFALGTLPRRQAVAHAVVEQPYLSHLDILSGCRSNGNLRPQEAPARSPRLQPPRRTDRPLRAGERRCGANR
jgi:hypothetical protein